MPRKYGGYIYDIDELLQWARNHPEYELKPPKSRKSVLQGFRSNIRRFLAPRLPTPGVGMFLVSGIFPHYRDPDDPSAALRYMFACYEERDPNATYYECTPFREDHQGEHALKMKKVLTDAGLPPKELVTVGDPHGETLPGGKPFVTGTILH